jgi:uncharacterized repeat protein (TIGR03803 family)
MKERDRKSKLELESGAAGAIVCLICAITFAAVLPGVANAQTYSVLYTFMGNSDGAFPDITPILDSAGNLYGASAENSSLNCKGSCSNIFKIDPSGNETTLFTSKNGSTTGYGVSSLALDKSGMLYATMEFGGPGAYGYVFKLNKKGKRAVLHNFPVNSQDGQAPANLILDAKGNMYGLTIQGGGTGCNGFGCGTVFELTKKRQETIVDFSSAAYVPDSLVRDASGNFYGTTYQGGSQRCGGGCGTVFKIDTSGTVTVLYAFQGAPDGSLPEGDIAIDSAGNLYGATWEGGNSSACTPSGCGTVYKLDPSGKETVLHKFSVSDGMLPEGGVVLDSAGNLYGTTFAGGTSPSCRGSGCGTVYKIDTNGKQTVLYSFSSGSDGGFPAGGLVFDSAGNLYGTALYGGFSGGNGLCFPSGCGTVFKLTP